MVGLQVLILTIGVRIPISELNRLLGDFLLRVQYESRKTKNRVGKSTKVPL